MAAEAVDLPSLPAVTPVRVFRNKNELGYALVEGRFTIFAKTCGDMWAKVAIPSLKHVAAFDTEAEARAFIAAAADRLDR